MGNYYELLEVAETASEEVIRAVYKAKIKQWHPDNFQAEREKEKATKILQDLNEAFEVLVDKNQRANYDKKLHSSYYEERSKKEYNNQNQTEQATKTEIVERVQYMISLTTSEQEYFELHRQIRQSDYSEMDKILMSEVLDQIIETRIKNEIMLAEKIGEYKEEVKNLKRGIIIWLVIGVFLTNWISSAFFIACVLALFSYIGGSDDRERVKMAERANEHISKYHLKGFCV